MEHIVREANEQEGKEDCCGDRVESNVDFVCSCGLKACEYCMKSHLLSLHISKQLSLLEESQ